MAPYNGKERRQASSDTLMLLDKIQEIAIIAAKTQTSVESLREDVSELKKTTASCSDIKRIEKSHSDHLVEHEQIKKEATETKRWSIGAIIAAAGMLLPFIGGLFGWGKS